MKWLKVIIILIVVTLFWIAHVFHLDGLVVFSFNGLFSHRIDSLTLIAITLATVSGLFLVFAEFQNKSYKLLRILAKTILAVYGLFVLYGIYWLVMVGCKLGNVCGIKNFGVF